MSYFCGEQADMDIGKTVSEEKKRNSEKSRKRLDSYVT